MPSSALRLPEVRAVYELAHECRELGDTHNEWRQHLIAGLARLTGAELAIGGEMFGCRAGRPRPVGAAEWGWENGFDRDVWVKSVAELQRGETSFQLLNGYTDRLRAEDGVCLTRTGMMSDREWYRSAEYQTVLRSIGADHTLWCFRSIARAPRDEFSGMIFYRAAGSTDFKPRASVLLREAHALVAPLIGGALARLNEPSPADLAPRVRAVLQCLLEGDSDKQIAGRLGISKYTVNQYVKVIFAHFGTATRSELLARWIRRGWGNAFAWAGADALE